MLKKRLTVSGRVLQMVKGIRVTGEGDWRAPQSSVIGLSVVLTVYDSYEFPAGTAAIDFHSGPQRMSIAVLPNGESALGFCLNKTANSHFELSDDPFDPMTAEPFSCHFLTLDCSLIIRALKEFESAEKFTVAGSSLRASFPQAATGYSFIPQGSALPSIHKLDEIPHYYGEGTVVFGGQFVSANLETDLGDCCKIIGIHTQTGLIPLLFYKVNSYHESAEEAVGRIFPGIWSFVPINHQTLEEILLKVARA